MGIPQEHGLAYRLAETIIREIDPENELKLVLQVDLSDYSAPESSDEIVVSHDMLADFPVVGAMVLVRDAMRRHVGEVPIPTPENILWMESGNNFKDAAFSIVSTHFREKYLDSEIVGSSFRKVDNKLAITFRPANPIEQAQNLLARAMMGRAAEKLQQRIVTTGKTGKKLSLPDLMDLISAGDD